MKKAFLLATVLLGVAIAAPAAEDKTSLGTVKTVTGKIYEDCRLFSEDVDGIIIFHRHGGAKIAFSELPAPLRQKFGYDAEKDAAYQKERLETVRKQREEFWSKQREIAAAEAKVQRENAMMQQMLSGLGGYDSVVMPQYLWSSGFSDGAYFNIPGSQFYSGFNGYGHNHPYNYVMHRYHRYRNNGGKDFPSTGLSGGLNQVIRHSHAPRPVAPAPPRFGIPALGGLAPSL